MRADLTEGMAVPSHSPEDNFEREEKGNKEEIQQSTSGEGSIAALYSVNTDC